MKRITALLAALLAMLAVACTQTNPENSTSDTTVAPTVTETEAVSADLAIVKDGVANYRIVRPEDASEVTIKAASRLREMIGDKTGVNLKLGTDWTTYGAELDHEALEILVGATAYAESAQALEGVSYGDYVITRVGNKLVINAWFEEGITSAITALSRELVLNASEGNFVLPQDYRLTGTKLKIVNALPLYADGTLRKIYDAGEDSYVLVLDDADPEEYAAYCKKLETAGYELYAENDITDNKFATYTNDKYTVNVGYYAYETACRIVVEPKTTLQPLEADNKYEKLVQPSVAMLGQEIIGNDGTKQNTQSGMCLIFQMADGSYIVVDGGYRKDVLAKDIYDYMYKYAPDKNNITIAAWIMTHGHNDHQGAFQNFSATYAPKVKLERLVANYPSEEFVAASDPSHPDNASDMLKKISAFKGAQYIRAHVGQEFYLRDAKVEILFTMDSLTPDVLDNYNTTSMIFTVELGGQKINVLGDADEKGCQIALNMFGDYLKADIIQMAHHGYGTGSSSSRGVTGVYDKSASPVVLWPVGMEIGYITTSSRSYTKHLVELETTKEIFVAGYRIVRLPLPYTIGTSGCESILK